MKYPFARSPACSAPWSGPTRGGREKKVVGWIEKVRISPGNFIVHAKLDSGAEYSSLDAANLTEFDRKGEPWVRFDLTERDGQKITIERPLLRTATIKRHYLQSQKRPVIKLGVCIGNLYQETEVNLVDRTGFIYPLLIGRKFMEGRRDPSDAVQAHSRTKLRGAARE